MNTADNTPITTSNTINTNEYLYFEKILKGLKR